MDKLISVITVCYNAEEEIKRTIDSILDQNIPDLEYIVVDGKSSDGTVEYVTGKRPFFEEKKINFKVISEIDKGIYNAMNKGIDLAEGKWVLFLNAGDVFYDANVLERVSGFLRNSSDADVVYGDVVLKKGDKYKFEKADYPEKILYQMPFCHQSSFTKRDVLKEYRFNEDYKICADHEMFMRCYRDGKVFRAMPFAVAIYELFGKSSEDLSHSFWMERLMIQKESGYISEEEFANKAKELENSTRNRKFRQFIKKLTPGFIIDKRQERIDQESGWSTEYPKLTGDGE